MIRPRSAIAALGAGACAAALSACGTALSTQPAFPTISGIGSQPHPATSQQRVLAGLAVPPRTSAAHQRSWISSQAKSRSLLYVATNVGNAGIVNVYSYPALKPLGMLFGFKHLYTMCVDAKADVYIPDPENFRVLEYAHGSITPLRSLKNTQGSAGACAVDPITGNLAVLNAGPAYVFVYAKAKGIPSTFIPPDILFASSVAYDNKGNLFLDGSGSSESVLLLDELPKGQRLFEGIALDQAIESAGGLAWDGKYLAFTDFFAGVIYQFEVSGSKATKQGATPLNGASDGIDQIFPTGGSAKHPQATTVLGADAFLNAVDQWPYPAGGDPEKVISGLEAPEGIVISK